MARSTSYKEQMAFWEPKQEPLGVKQLGSMIPTIQDHDMDLFLPLCTVEGNVIT